MTITHEQLEKIESLARRRGEFELNELAEAIHVEKIDAMMMAMRLFLDNKAALQWHAFHSCSDDNIEIRPFKDGFKTRPYICPKCQNTSLNTSDTTYELWITYEPTPTKQLDTSP